jgi:hypothetical protein
MGFRSAKPMRLRLCTHFSFFFPFFFFFYCQTPIATHRNPSPNTDDLSIATCRQRAPLETLWLTHLMGAVLVRPTRPTLEAEGGVPGLHHTSPAEEQCGLLKVSSPASLLIPGARLRGSVFI